MGTSNTMSATISTNGGNDMLIGLGYGGKGAIIPGPGFTGICINADGCAIGNLDSISSEYKMVTTPQLGTVVSVTQTGGTSWGFIADAVLSELPTVTSVSPSKGAVGAPLTITGASFTNVATLTFCGKAQSFTIASDQIIWTSAPQISSPSNIQTCDIVVTGGAGSPFAVYWGTRNFFIFMRRHATLRRLVVNAFPQWARLTAFFLSSPRNPRSSAVKFTLAPGEGLPLSNATTSRSTPRSWSAISSAD